MLFQTEFTQFYTTCASEKKRKSKPGLCSVVPLWWYSQVHGYLTRFPPPQLCEHSMADPASLSFDEMMEKDSEESTKCRYQGLAKHFIEIMKTHKPDVVDTDCIALAEVTNEDLKHFFDHVCIKHINVKRDGVFSEPVAPVNCKNVLNSASYVASYRSVLKWFY